VYETSEDQDPLTVRKIGNEIIEPVIVIDEYMITDWVVCIYGNNWCVGIVRATNIADNEMEIFWKSRGTLFLTANASCWIQSVIY
jgi:hypothetical protein